MAVTCPHFPESLKLLSRISRTLLLVLIFFAGTVAVACAKGERVTPLHVTAAAAAVSPKKEDGGSLPNEKEGRGNADANSQPPLADMDAGDRITLMGVVLSAVIALITAIWAFFKWIYPLLSAKSARKKLLADLAERHRATLRAQIKKQSLSTTAFDGVSVTLADTFVPLRMSDTWRNENRFMPAKSLKSQGNDGIHSPEEVLQKAFKNEHRKLLVVGEPGSGKTTLLYYYALLCLEKKLYEKCSFRLPDLVFYLPLRELRRVGEEYPLLPATLLASSKRHSHAIEEDVFFDWLRASTTLVLLDGLDEISDIAQRREVCAWIDNAVASFPKAYFIVTSRTTGLRKGDNVKLKNPDAVQVDIMDFTPGQQATFLRRWFEAAFLEEAFLADKTPAWQKSQREKAGEKAEPIIAFLTAEENRSLQSLAGIPLLLQLMAMLWKNIDYLPSSRVELYSKALHYILEYREPLLAASHALNVLTPVAFWMQQEVERDEVEREAMQQQMQAELIKLPQPPAPELFCKNLVERAGLLVEYGERAYLFRHKSFREYLAAMQLVRTVELLQDEDPEWKSDGCGNYLAELAAHFGEGWWKEPICFFAAQASTVLFNAFLEQLFDLPVSLDFSQEQQDLLDRVMEERPRGEQERPREELAILSAKLLEPATTANRQRYLLKCLQTGRQPQAAAVVRKFIELNLAQDDDIRRRAADFTATGVLDRQGAPYVLIEGGSFVYTKTKKQQAVPDLHVARYLVTNQLYRRFIAYLDGSEPHVARILPLERYRERLLAVAQGNRGFRRYLKGRENLAKLFRSYYDDDRKFNGADQPVVSISWYAARAYCLWLSLLENNNSNPLLYRLPTEMEWEYAAGGKEGRRYPWGSEEPTSTRANYGNNEGATTPVGRYPAGVTPEGLYDMAGNVWEWMENRYGFGLLPLAFSVIAAIFWSIADKRLYAPFALRSLRGGSWRREADALRCSSRDCDDPWLNDVLNVGFRVIRSSHFSLPEHLIL